MRERLPKDRIIECRLLFALPAAATREQVLEWVAFQLHCSSIGGSSPLVDHQLEALAEPTLADTGRRYVEEPFQLPDGRRAFRGLAVPDTEEVWDA